MSEKTYPMVRLLDPTGEGVWIATEHITAIQLATQGSDDKKAISKVLVNGRIAVDVQGTPDEIVQFLASAVSDGTQEDTDTLDADENGTTD